MDEREGGADSKYSANAVHLMRTVQQIHFQLSAMADQKASLLMAATFVIFTIAIGQAKGAETPLPLLILGGAAFLAALCTILAIIPATRSPDPAKPNLLFFGSFSELDEEEYIGRMDALLHRDRDIYESMARDIHQNGMVLARKKYRLLGYAYRIFLVGLVASAVAFGLLLIGSRT